MEGIWYSSNPGSVFNRAKTPLLKHTYPSPVGCGDSCSNILNADTNNPSWNIRFGFLGGSNETLIGNLGYTQSTVNSPAGYVMYNGIFPHLSQGSLQNHFYNASSGNLDSLYGTNPIDLRHTRNSHPDNLDQWGKILPYSETSDIIYKFDGNLLPNPLLGHTPRLSDITTAKDSNYTQRVEYLWDHCYGNGEDNWQNEYSLVNFKNDILGDKSFSYRCITGDTLSDFINDDDVNDIEALMSDIHDRFIDINHLGRGLQDFEERPSDQEIVDFFDITKNTFGLFECGKLLPIFEDPNKKSAALHIDSSTLKTGLKLSVYNDWNGVYRKASTTRGPFEIVGNSINCASSGNLGLP